MKTFIFRENIAWVAAVFWRLDCSFQNNATAVWESFLYKITFLEKEPLELEIKLKKKKRTKFVILENKTDNPSDND